ncbi:UNVERIFIED_CONTAM: hypothetical protein Cloal_0851 [Acetivibrio alkalicellulosi]
MTCIEVTKTLYEEFVHSKNLIYSQSIFDDIVIAKLNIEKYLCSLSNSKLIEQLKEILIEQEYQIIYECDDFCLAETKSMVFCFLFRECSMDKINIIAKKESKVCYTMVYSILNFIKTYMNKCFLSLLLRDYSILNFNPTEYQQVQSVLSTNYAEQ